MSQSKRHSALETATNTAVGFVGSFFITYACFHIQAPLEAKTLYATLGCTVWSLLRGYYLRRVFNHLHTKALNPPLKRKGRHDFIKTGDPDSHHAIEDSTGDVVLSYCRRCKCAEGELPTQCPGEEVLPSARFNIYRGRLDFRNGAWRHLSAKELKR